jgi:hypothetical protein
MAKSTGGGQWAIEGFVGSVRVFDPVPDGLLEEVA